MRRPRSLKVGWGPRFRDPFLESTDGRSPASASRSRRPRTGQPEARVAARGIERKFRDVQLFPTINDASGPLRSQSGPGASMFLRTTLCNPVHPPLPSTPSAAPSDEAHLPLLPPHRFLWPPPRSLCSVRGSCSSGVLQWRAWLPECAVRAGSSRRIEILANGLALFGGVQFAIRHHTGLPSPRRWFSTSWGCAKRWCGSQSCDTLDSGHTTDVDWLWGKSEAMVR